MSEQAKRELIEQLDRSGIPAAVAQERRVAAVRDEFGGDAAAMAAEILKLRAELAAEKEAHGALAEHHNARCPCGSFY